MRKKLHNPDLYPFEDPNDAFVINAFTLPHHRFLRHEDDTDASAFAHLITLPRHFGGDLVIATGPSVDRA